MIFVDMESLIPENHLLRKINRTVSFDFIYDLLAPYYPATGRPSVDPVSMFKMLLIGYLYGIKSERRLVEEVQLNIAYRWFCGFELDDTIPNHSTFSKTRTRKWQQSDLFQKAFYEIVKQCIDSGLIDGEAMAADGSYIPANVSRESWIVGTPEYLAMMRLRKIWAEGSFSVLKREHCISRIRKRGILAATEECLLAAMALNLKRMVNAIFRYPQIYCSAGTSVGFSSFFAFVNRSLIVPYPHESPGRIRYDSVCKTAAKIVNIVKVEHTLPLRDGVCSTNAQIRDGSSYLVIRKSGTTVTPHLYSLE